MALDIAETTYAPTGARVVQDQTAQRALQVAAPAVGEAVVGFAEGQLQKEIGSMETSLQNTLAYVNDLRAQQATLDPARQDDLAASVQLSEEIDKVMKGQRQGLMSATQAEARLSSTVRQLSRQFPVAAGTLRSLVSSGSQYAMNSSALAQLTAEEERYQAVEKQIDTDMINAGLDPLNPSARASWRMLTAQTQNMQLEATLNSRQAALLQSRRLVSEEENMVTAASTINSTIGAMQPDLLNIVNSIEYGANGGVANSALVMQQIDTRIAAAKTALATNLEGLRGVDLASSFSRLDDLRDSYSKIIENGSISKVHQSVKDDLIAGTESNLLKLNPALVYMTDKFGEDFLAARGEARRMGPTALAQFDRDMGVTDLNKAIELQTGIISGTATSEQIDALTHQATENPSLKLPDEILESSYKQLGYGRMNRFLKNQGHEFVKKYPEWFSNRFESETAQIEADGSLRTAAAEGNTFTYDEGTKTLVVVNSEGRYVQHYSVPQGTSKMQQNTSRARVNQFLETVPGYGEAPTLSGTRGSRVRRPQASMIDTNILRRITDGVENIRVNGQYIAFKTPKSYFDFLTQGQQ